jgi:hypothetical protein
MVCLLLHYKKIIHIKIFPDVYVKQNQVGLLTTLLRNVQCGSPPLVGTVGTILASCVIDISACG